ncbi:hypothetical protein, partial [Staphylococcus epidermidis]|uniref:hypothetical protein n=1 Tax=Staphylococcus epidermidis TaxID=1282 RepID=UPI001E2DB6FE
GTYLGQMYPPPKTPSGHCRGPKLRRDTSNNDTNRFRVILGRFRVFEIFVHFCSFCSFQEPGAL